MSMIFEDETAETEAERTRDFSGISSQDPQAESERAFEIEVGQQAAGMRIDSYLTEEIEDAARSYIQRLIEEGRIAVQGRPKTAKNYKLRAGRPDFRPDSSSEKTGCGGGGYSSGHRL